jgi:hypothetical protein
MPQVNSIPSQKEYEKVLLGLQDKYNKVIEDKNNKYHFEITKKNFQVVTTIRGGRGCRGGGTACLAWVDKAASDWNNIYHPAFERRLQSIKKEISDYQKDVKQLQDNKDQAELEAAIKVQQGIMQQNIRDTFKIETEKLRAELETIPQDEPLQILNEVQHIKPEIIETTTKSNNSKYFIIGGIGIAALVLLLILRRRK